MGQTKFHCQQEPKFGILIVFSPMASIGKRLFFFFALVLFSSVQIQARESKFFSKFTHYSTKNNVNKRSRKLPVEAPTTAPALAPAPIFTVSENGYDPFGHGSGFHLTKGTTTTATTPTISTDENELLNEELDGVTYESGYHSSNIYDNNGYTSNYNNNGYTGNYNNNGYKLARARYERSNQNNNNGYTSNDNNNGYKLASESYEIGNQNKKNGYIINYNKNGYTNNYNNKGYENEQQGMSDTRFMAGGKYYFHVKSENYYPANGYESGKLSIQNQGYYGNTDNPNEFNTKEYENQEAYEERQEETLP